MTLTMALIGLLAWWAISSAVAALIAARDGVAVNRELLMRGPIAVFTLLREHRAAAPATPAAVASPAPAPVSPAPVAEPAPSPVPAASSPDSELPPPPLGSNIFDSIDRRERELSSRPPLPASAPLAPEPEMAVLDGRFELEAFDRLPQRPRAGWIKTVCPTCRKKTRHDREAVCRKCKRVNTWLSDRWQVDQQQENTSMPAVGAIAPHENMTSGQVRCPSCSRRAVPDLHGRCAFCSYDLGVTS